MSELDFLARHAYIMSARATSAVERALDAKETSVTYVPTPAELAMGAKALGDTVSQGLGAATGFLRQRGEKELRAAQKGLLEAEADAKRAAAEEGRARARAMDAETAKNAVHIRLTEAKAEKVEAEARDIRANAAKKEAETHLLEAQADLVDAQADRLRIENGAVRAQLCAEITERVAKAISAEYRLVGSQQA